MRKLSHWFSLFWCIVSLPNIQTGWKLLLLKRWCHVCYSLTSFLLNCCISLCRLKWLILRMWKTYNRIFRWSIWSSFCRSSAATGEWIDSPTFWCNTQLDSGGIFCLPLWVHTSSSEKPMLFIILDILPVKAYRCCTQHKAQTGFLELFVPKICGLHVSL